MMDFGNGSQYALSPNLEAISEARVMTNGYNAEYGRGAGGVMDVSLKSGTNALHGSVFGSFTDQNLDANNYFSNALDIPRPDSNAKTYGVTAGGPVVKNKTFWFVDYSGSRSSGSSLSYYTLPYNDFKTGNFSELLTGATSGMDWLGTPIPQGGIYDFRSTQWVDLGGGNYAPIRTQFPGNIMPASELDPVALKIAAMLPTPNTNLNYVIPSNDYYGLAGGQGMGNQGDMRIDHHLSDKNMLFGSFSIENNNGTSTTPLRLDLCHCNPAWEVNGWNTMASWTHVFSPTIVSETRMAFTRLHSHSQQAQDNVDSYKQYGIGGYDPFSPSHGGLPELQMDNYSYLGSPAMSPSIEYSNVWDFIQNLAIQHGSNSLKFGFEARVIDFPFEYSWEPQGMFYFPRAQTSNFADLADTGDGFASFLQGIPYAGRVSTSNMISDRRLGYSAYVQDDWKATSKLSFNFGLRYELFSPIEELNGEQANLDPNTLTYQIPAGNAANNPLPAAFPSILNVERGTVSQFLIPWKKKNFAPRFGLAYQPMKATVVRLAYGIFYGGEENESGLPNRGNNVPFNYDAVLLPSDPTVTPTGMSTLAAGFPQNVMTQSMVLLRSIENDALPAMAQKWSAAVQRQLGWDTNLEVSYLGEHGSHLLTVWNINQPTNTADPTAPTAPRRMIPEIDSPIVNTATFGKSNYDALAVKAEKRLSHGLSFLASYTWSHALSDVVPPLSGSYGTSVPRDVTNYGADYSNAAFDTRQRFVVSSMWELPVGRGKALGKNWNHVADAIAGGWQLNTIFTAQTGQAYTLSTRDADCGCGDPDSGQVTVLPNILPGANPNAAPAGGRTINEWFNTANFTAPTPGTYGTLGMQSNFSPGLVNLDMSLFKSFTIAERYRLQLRVEADSATNTPHWGTPDNTQGDPNFGVISTAGGSRSVILSMRFQY